ncbi:ABC transporter ATP-binding protein [Natrinema salifodinae]|uniref:ABC-2 type transport system ATP-binding protein n=1 Tax=Natrinema salifodinae TaxID=1202768 RepID=A0A1I0PCZ7_9EURY|nr:ABC transporter ATP-binding protein [Natrinema salifodinae]SEW12077.1 ABC-2 type transport system ATP-binding protein [Natrinema salifodinae]
MAAIELEGLTKDYGEVLANDGVTFDVDRGEIFGYLGPNGAGKTTTIRTLLGFIAPTAGTARLLGHEVTDEGELLEAKRRLGYLPDSPAFDETATGREVLDLHASIKGDRRSDELLDRFDPPVDREIRDYSRGNVQKLGLVTTFMHDPDLVILDEPTSGLDPLLQQRFAEFLRAERERGVTVFFSSHILSEVRRLCDRVGIIRNGRLVTVEPVESLLDRSGKVVRLRATKPLPRDALAIDGVHDLESDADAAGAGASEGVADDDGGGTETETGTETEPEAGAGTRTATGSEYAFTFTGDVNALLDRLREYRLLDLSIEEAPLEDIFMRFYGQDDGDERRVQTDRLAAGADAPNPTGDEARADAADERGQAGEDDV